MTTFQKTISVILLLVALGIATFVSVAFRGPTIVMPPSAAGVSVQIEDDFKAWKKTFLDPSEREAPPIPAWADNGAEASYEHREQNGLVSVTAFFPGPQAKLVGYSPQLEPTREAAVLSARRSATRQLSAALVWHLATERGIQESRTLQAATVRAEFTVGPRIQELTSGEYVAVVSRRYGELHRAAIQVDARTETLNALSDAVLEQVARGNQAQVSKRRRTISGVFSGLGLALCVFLIYCFLNAGTKGYFAWPLRVFSLAALVLLFVLVYS